MLPLPLRRAHAVSESLRLQYRIHIDLGDDARLKDSPEHIARFLKTQLGLLYTVLQDWSVRDPNAIHAKAPTKNGLCGVAGICYAGCACSVHAYLVRELLPQLCFDALETQGSCVDHELGSLVLGGTL